MKYQLKKILTAIGIGIGFSIFGYVMSGSELSFVVGTYIIYKELRDVHE